MLGQALVDQGGLQMDDDWVQGMVSGRDGFAKLSGCQVAGQQCSNAFGASCIAETEVSSGGESTGTESLSELPPGSRPSCGGRVTSVQGTSVGH